MLRKHKSEEQNNNVHNNKIKKLSLCTYCHSICQIEFVIHFLATVVFLTYPFKDSCFPKTDFPWFQLILDVPSKFQLVNWEIE